MDIRCKYTYLKTINLIISAMKTIILGKEGNQPFKIQQSAVSRQHARITIDDSGRWTIEDLNSANGTFVRRERDGRLVRVGTIDINPMTFICLGPCNARGCCFYARQVLEENYGFFDKEYEYLNDMNDRYEAKIEKVNQRMKLIRWITPLVSFLIMLLSIIGEKQGWLTGSDNLLLLRLGPLVTSVIVALFDGAGIKRNIEKERERFSQCPNPLCEQILRPSDIRNFQCPRCRK